MAGALQGVRVLDFTQMMAGPLCPTLLGDFGADVIKVEPPQGDPMRHMGELRLGGESNFFLSVNRNKRSIVLDLKTETGRRTAKALAETADVVVENFRPGTAAGFGLSYEDVCQENPTVIYCSISGFPLDGPDRDRPALDPVMQAMSGLMSLTGDASSGPLCSGMPISDLVTPIFATVGVLAALYARAKTGLGQRIDLSMLDASVFALVPREGEFFVTNRENELLGNRRSQMVPYNAYRTSDGRSLMVIAHNDKFWQALLRGLELDDLIEDPRFSDNANRIANREIVEDLLSKRFLSADLSTWVARLTDADALFAPVRGLAEVFADPQIRKDMVAKIDHPAAGEISLLANPINLFATPAVVDRPPPTLGQHSDEILSQLESGTPWRSGEE